MESGVLDKEREDVLDMALDTALDTALVDGP